MQFNTDFHGWTKRELNLKLNRNSTILCLGSCGLHVTNGALQTGHKASKWNVHALLKFIYKLFKDSSARRADYTALTEVLHG